MIVRTVGPSRAVRRRTKASVMFAALLAVPTGALHAEDAALAEIFSRHGVQGTMVLMDDGGRKSVHDDARAQRRQPAASTFKIPNTLIAVQESVAAGPEHVFRWDGRVHAIASWNADQTLASAFRVSCVWCYQRLAERVGVQRYRDWLGRIGYGALAEPFVVTEFWLDGSLTISAIEQVEFLRRLQRRELPFDTASYDTLADIMLIERTPTHTLFAKTGLAGRVTPRIGWYVGYLETVARGTWYFATQIDLRSDEDLALRERLTREALQAVGALP